MALPVCQPFPCWWTLSMEESPSWMIIMTFPNQTSCQLPQVPLPALDLSLLELLPSFTATLSCLCYRLRFSIERSHLLSFRNSSSFPALYSPLCFTPKFWFVIFLLDFLLGRSGPLPQGSNCQWAAISGLFSQWSAERWSSGGEWGKRRIPAFSLGPSSSPGLCDLMAEAICLGRSLQDLAPAVWAAWGAWGPVGSWAPGSLGDDGWAGSGDLALREPPAEICLFSQAWALAGGPSLGAGWTLRGRVTGPCRDPLLLARTWTSAGESCALGPCPFLVRTESNICLVEIYRNVVTWPWPDLKSKGSDTKKSATTNHTRPSPFL